MRILAIETATSLGSVALLQDGETIAVISEFVPQRHLEWLAPALRQLLVGAGWTAGQVEGMAVSTGPGSFTSLRIGIATATAWARARGIPAAGVPTLDAVALGTQAAGPVCAIVDVRRGEVAAGVYTRDGPVRRVMDEVVGPVERVVGRLPAGPLTLSGDALVRYAEEIARLRPDAVLAPRAQWYPTAVSVGRLGWERLSRGEHNDLYRLWPTYVRAPTDTDGGGTGG